MRGLLIQNRIRVLIIDIFICLCSSIDEDEREEEEASGENLMELDRLLTADETRKLAESWKKRYSSEPSDRLVQADYQESLKCHEESIPESKTTFSTFLIKFSID